MSTGAKLESPIETEAIPVRSDPRDGSTHPPSPNPKKAERSDELRPALSWMRGQMVQELVKRLRRKHRSKIGAELRGRMRKRKTALAMSAAVMGLSTGASDISAFDPRYSISLMDLDPTEQRVHAMDLRVSETMKEALAEEEGVRLVVYRDVAGYPTVGVGHLITPQDGLSVGDRITYEQAIAFLESDLEKAEKGVKRLVGDLPIYQHEFDALVDLVYNVGEGNVSESQSPRLNRAIANADYDSIAEQLEYTTAAGKVARGLQYRSERRQSIFMEASYEDPRAVEVDKAGRISA
ncbi:lysozyme [Aurantiacibacter rhizosphaerae]|nr:lysozyme [Aurantiacibacter rhizosphaerae]